MISNRRDGGMRGARQGKLKSKHPESTNLVIGEVVGILLLAAAGAGAGARGASGAWAGGA